MQQFFLKESYQKVYELGDMSDTSVNVFASRWVWKRKRHDLNLWESKRTSYTPDEQENYTAKSPTITDEHA